MSDEMKSEAAENGNEKSGSRLAQLAGKPVAQMLLMSLITAAGTIGGASYVVGSKVATYENGLANTRQIAIRAEQKAETNKMAIAESYKQLAGLRISIGKRFANMKSDMIKGHGEIKEIIARAVTDIGWMKTRIDEDSWRARQWLERNKR